MAFQMLVQASRLHHGETSHFILRIHSWPFALERREYKVNEWTVKITKDAIDYRNTAYDDHMVIRSDSGAFTHNGRTIGVK